MYVWVREGKGEYTYASGDKYEGTFKANEPHGRGRFVQFRTVNVDSKKTKPLDTSAFDEEDAATY